MGGSVMLRRLSQRLLARFSRVTSPGRQYVPQLDGLRFIALIWVIAFHVAGYVLTQTGHASDASRGNPLIAFFDAGHVGVDLFFVISGFILALPFARQYLKAANPVSLKAYFIRRLTRLEPPYIVHLMATFSLWACLGGFLAAAPFASQQYVPSHLLASLVYAHQFIYQTLPFPNLVLWSLEIEVQFYILAPLLALVFTIASPTFRRLVIVAAILAFSGIALAGREVFLVPHSLLGSLQQFLAGFLLADLYVTRWKTHAAGSYLWDLLSLAGWMGIVFSDRLGLARTPILPWLIFLAYVGVLRGVVLNRILGNPWIATVGGMCYTIYMYHGWLILAVGKTTMYVQTGLLWVDVAIQFAILSTIILIVCSVLFLLFERPFMQPDWHKRAWATLFPPRPLPEVETP